MFHLSLSKEQSDGQTDESGRTLSYAGSVSTDKAQAIRTISLEFFVLLFIRRKVKRECSRDQLIPTPCGEPGMKRKVFYDDCNCPFLKCIGETLLTLDCLRACFR